MQLDKLWQSKNMLGSTLFKDTGDLKSWQLQALKCNQYSQQQHTNELDFFETILPFETSANSQVEIDTTAMEH